MTYEEEGSKKASISEDDSVLLQDFLSTLVRHSDTSRWLVANSESVRLCVKTERAEATDLHSPSPAVEGKMETLMEQYLV